MTERIKILDIGIGDGGSYISHDHPSVTRIGLDWSLPSLSRTSENYHLPLLRADASGEVAAFPFKSQSFNHIDIFFPHSELLYGLCHSGFLWQEMHRILLNAGDITIVTDTGYFGEIGTEVHGRDLVIDHSPERISFQASQYGFIPEISRLTSDQTRAYGTSFSIFTANWQETSLPPKVFLINLKRR